eukprot:GHVR01083012.1.p1 GENE.GHVR01083012.1~~GHVR01083012.1.p1  ORF type:complete len:352 (-),score=75.45 GHVR01083012.1:456-1511(-)
MCIQHTTVVHQSNREYSDASLLRCLRKGGEKGKTVDHFLKALAVCNMIVPVVVTSVLSETMIRSHDIPVSSGSVKGESVGGSQRGGHLGGSDSINDSHDIEDPPPNKYDKQVSWDHIKQHMRRSSLVRANLLAHEHLRISIQDTSCQPDGTDECKVVSRASSQPQPLLPIKNTPTNKPRSNRRNSTSSRRKQRSFHSVRLTQSSLTSIRIEETQGIQSPVDGMLSEVVLKLKEGKEDVKRNICSLPLDNGSVWGSNKGWGSSMFGSTYGPLMEPIPQPNPASPTIQPVTVPETPISKQHIHINNEQLNPNDLQHDHDQSFFQKQTLWPSSEEVAYPCSCAVDEALLLTARQ